MIVSFYHSTRFNVLSGIEECDLAGNLFISTIYTFSYHKTQRKTSGFSFEVCHSITLCFFSPEISSFEDFISMCWLVHFILRILTAVSHRTVGPCLRSHGNVQFIQQFPENPTILYLVLLDENTGITFNFINDGTLDERCWWKSATSVCCIHFSAGSTYSSCLMMLIHTASFTDKCVFGYIHHPEWVFLMSHPLACFTLSTIR